jgi:hypothetical protein
MPFLLDPTLPSTPVNKRARYEAKFGGAEKVAAMERVMKEKARACGINLSYGGEMSQPTDALRLSSLAWEMGGMERQLDLMERLFKVRLRLERRQPWPFEVSAMPLCSPSAFTLCALSQGYFEQEKDLGDRTFLVSQALEAKVFSSEAEVRLTLLCFRPSVYLHAR